jgi:predicted SAM-dependent methyltransferase
VKPDDNATRFELAPYFHGKILDVSEGISRCYPHFISYLNCALEDPSKLGMFTDGSLDGVCSSYVLHLMGPDSCKEALKEWSRVIRKGGHIMLHLPVNHESAMWDVSYESIVELMDSVPRDWDMVKHIETDGLLSVFRLK